MSDHLTGSRGFPRLDRRGVALPVALLGLVVITLMVTAALLTSTTEMALSGAHSDATRGLYRTDSAIESFVAGRAAMQSPTALVNGTFSHALGRDTFSIRVSRLANLTSSGTGSVSGTEVFAVVATPSGGRGRTVGAMITATRVSVVLQTNFTSGAVSGGDFRVQGNATISNRSTLCADTAKNALEVTSGSKVTVSGNPTIVGRVDTLSYTKDKLVQNVLGGTPLDTLVKYANIKFGPRFQQPDFNGRASSSDFPRSSPYNWGCPASMGIPACVTSPDTSYYPVVAIDAKGGTVNVTGDWGQGILIVVNGGLQLTGNFVYKGIIVVEKDLNIGGGQGKFDGKIEGAVLALGSSSTIEDQVGGNAVIVYNKCAITAAENALSGNGLNNAAQSVSGRSYAWFEIVR